MTRTALIAGVTGIVGNNLARTLHTHGWQVDGLARRATEIPDGTRFLAADLLDPASLARALEASKPTHVFIATWLRQATEAENIRVNSAMVRNLLDAVEPGGSVEHVALVTGLKHYLGPFESYGKGTLPATPFREDQPRLPIENFYYAQEDEVFAAARRQGFTWSVHRPHTIIGYAVGNAMNMGVTLAVYATICRETGMPFVFPGSATQWNSLTDMTDANLLARHLEWAATAPVAQNQPSMSSTETSSAGSGCGSALRITSRFSPQTSTAPALLLNSSSPRQRQCGAASRRSTNSPSLTSPVSRPPGIRRRPRTARRSRYRHEQEPTARVP